MTYLVLLIIVAVVINAAVIGTLARSWPRSARKPAAPAVAPATTERQLCADLVAGRLDPAAYQQAMAGIAHRTSQPGPGYEIGVLTGAEGDPRARLAMLAVALPEVSPGLLCSAFVMAQHGTDIETLAHKLNLTHWQAATIVAGSRR